MASSVSGVPFIYYLPEVALEKIFSFLSYDEIAKNRVVCKRFNAIGSKLLSRGFLQLEKRHAIIYKRVKSSLPRRESERKTHPLARHSDILQAVETRISMLHMTYSRYIENNLICFIPGKVLDEMKIVLDMAESDQTPPRTHQLLQELRDLSSMAMEHFDEHILPKVKEQLETRTGSPEKILKELEVVAGSISPYSRFQDVLCRNVASTSRSSRLLVHQQLQHVLSTEIHKVKKQGKTHKHHITYLTQSTHKLCVKLRKQNLRLKVQAAKIREQERKIQEQNSKIQEQETALAEIKKHIDEWDQKYKELTAELVRARDEILLKATGRNSSPASLSPPILTSQKFYKSNIKPRVAHILPKSYLQLDLERKRKSNALSEIPLKRNKSPNCEDTNKKNTEDIRINIPDIIDFKNNKVRNSDVDEGKGLFRDNSDIGSIITNSIENLLKGPLTNMKSRKRKMPDDIDLK